MHQSMVLLKKNAKQGDFDPTDSAQVDNPSPDREKA
jgi:hypothetical protein